MVVAVLSFAWIVGAPVHDAHQGSAPALIGRCAAPDGQLADTPCVDDADCPDGHVCSVSAFHPTASR
jgi:hypothetical protein